VSANVDRIKTILLKRHGCNIRPTDLLKHSHTTNRELLPNWTWLSDDMFFDWYVLIEWVLWSNRETSCIDTHDNQRARSSSSSRIVLRHRIVLFSLDKFLVEEEKKIGICNSAGNICLPRVMLLIISSSFNIGKSSISLWSTSSHKPEFRFNPWLSRN
jgi:hypothetical protein